MAKATDTTKSTPKTKRTPRSLEDRIAELQQLQEERAAKAKAKAQGEFDATVDKFRRALGQTQKFAGQIEELAETHGFDLPVELAAPTETEVEAVATEVQG